MTSTAAPPLDSSTHRRRVPAAPRAFVTTQWSAVFRANGSDTAAHAALGHLCRAYWYPLYAHVRREGHDAHDAQDLTQEFFARLLERDWLRQVTPERGRFRSFLLAALRHFLTNERAKGRALKRGGGIVHVPFDFDTAEERFRREPADTASPDRAYERQWALTLLGTALDRLRDELAAAGKEPLFAVLKESLGGPRETLPYAELGQSLGLSETAVKVAVHRLRKRYRELLRHAVAETLADDANIEQELRHLQSVLRGG